MAPKTDEDAIPEEEAGLNIGKMDTDFDKGDEIPALKKSETTTSFEAAWKQNAGENYKSTASAIDELIGNAITAVRRARDICDAWDAGILVRIDERAENEVYLTIRDEGIGMSEQFVDEVLNDIGTTSGFVGESSNTKFGRGFFAAYMLVGDGKNDASGSFTMSTNPRIDDSDEGELEPPYHTVHVPGDIYFVPENNAALEEDEYGTRLRFCVRDSVSADDLEEWVRDYAQYSRMPIMFERTYPDGSMENDEIGGKSIEHNYSEDATKVVVEEEGMFRAVLSDEAEGDVVILDAQTDTSNSLRINRGWYYDIRLLDEDGPIYKSGNEDHVGKTPISEEDYEKLPDEKKGQYILESEVNKVDDERMPQPSGTRDIIELDGEFREYIKDRLLDKATNYIESGIEKMDNLDDWDSLSKKEREIIGAAVTSRYRTFHLNRRLDHETRSMVENLGNSVDVVNRGENVDNRKSLRNDEGETMYVYQVMEKYDEVYYGNSLLQRRLDAVWKDSDESAVVHVKHTDYDWCERVGWNKITDVNADEVEEMDVPEETLNRFKKSYKSSSGNTSSSVPDKMEDRELTVHYDEYSTTEKITVGEIEQAFSDDESDTSVPSQIGRLVLFTSTTDEKISEHRHLVDPYTATASCVNKVYREKFADFDAVIRYDDFNNQNKDYGLLTDDGEMMVSDLPDKDVRFVLVGEWRDWISSAESETDVPIVSGLLPEHDGTTVAVSRQDVYAIRNHLDTFSEKALENTVSITGELSVTHDDSHIVFKSSSRGDGLSRLLNARFPKWDVDETPEMVSIVDHYNKAPLEEQIEVVDSYASLYDSDGRLNSEARGNSTEPLLDKTLETNVGTMTVREALDDDRKLCLYTAGFEECEILSEIPIKAVEDFVVRKGAEVSRFRRKIDYDSEDFILAVAPVSLVARVDDVGEVYGFHPLRGKSPSDLSSDSPHKTHTELYAHYVAEVESIDKGVLSHIESASLLPEGYNFIETFVGNMGE